MVEVMNPHSTSTSPLYTSSDIPAEAISRRAYELWEQEGRPDGCDLRHWLQAQKELGESQPASTIVSSASEQDGLRSVAPVPQTNGGTEGRTPQTPRTPGTGSREAKRTASTPLSAGKATPVTTSSQKPGAGRRL